MAELIKAQLAEIGIEVEIVQRDIATFVDEYAVQGTAQLAISWVGGYSDPYLILQDQASTASRRSSASRPGHRRAVTRSATTVDPEARVQVLRELEDAVAAKAGFQPLVTRDNFVAYRNDLIGNVTLAQGEGFGLPLWHRIEQITVTNSGLASEGRGAYRWWAPSLLPAKATTWRLRRGRRPHCRIGRGPMFDRPVRGESDTSGIRVNAHPGRDHEPWRATIVSSSDRLCREVRAGP
jgi:hypothetical protein